VAGLPVVIEALTQLQVVADEILRTYTGERLQLDLRARLFGRLQRLSLAYHDTRGTADAGYRVQYDALAIRTVAVDALIPFVTAPRTRPPRPASCRRSRGCPPGPPPGGRAPAIVRSSASRAPRSPSWRRRSRHCASS